MNGNIAAMAVAILANAFTNIGQSVQKLGSDRWFGKKKIGLPIWGLGILMTTISTLIMMWAVSLGDVSIIGAMAGTGLPFVVLFSILILKEPIGPLRQYLGVVVILVSAVFIGLFKTPGPENIMYPLRVWLLMGLVTLTFVLILIIIRGRTGKISGFWLSALAGSLRGFTPLFQKLAISPLGRAATPKWDWISHLPDRMEGIARSLANPYTLTWFMVVSVSMFIFQFAHRLDTAMRNIPSFTVAFVLLPVFGGILCFGEGVSIVLIIGVTGIIIGNTMVARQTLEGHNS